MYENYSICVSTEAETMVQMVESGIVPACAKDLSIYKDAPKLAGDRPKVCWVANKKFEISKFKFKIPRARTSELHGSFSAVSKPNFASKYSLESSRRDLHNALLCTVL